MAIGSTKLFKQPVTPSGYQRHQDDSNPEAKFEDITNKVTYLEKQRRKYVL